MTDAAPLHPHDMPPNVLQMLDAVVESASKTPLYRSILEGPPRIRSLDDFGKLPVTPVGSLRGRHISDLVADPAAVQWVTGPYAGHGREGPALAEGADGMQLRYQRLRRALEGALSSGHTSTCAILTAPERRYFAAEVSTLLGMMRVQAHVFTEDGTRRVYRRIREARPDILVVLSRDIEESELPLGLGVCVTFRRSHVLEEHRQIDLYFTDEAGVMGYSTDLERWVVYNDQYLFERANDERLVVTDLHSRTRPVLRVRLEDTVTSIGPHDIGLRLSSPRRTAREAAS